MAAATRLPASPTDSPRGSTGTAMDVTPAPPPGLPAPATPEQIQEFIERGVMLVTEVVNGRLAIGPSTAAEWPQVLPHLGTANGVHAVLRAMGMTPTARYPWQRLGIAWDDGPLPDANLIEARVRVGCQALEYLVAHLPAGPLADGCEKAMADIGNDGEECRSLLPDLCAGRRRREPALVLRYREVELPFLRYLHETMFPHATTQLCAQCSTCLGDATDDLFRCLDPFAARRLLDTLTRDAGKGAQALIDTMAEHWVIWAPDQASHLGRLFAAFRRVQRLQRGSRLTLLTARPLLPGAPTRPPSWTTGQRGCCAGTWPSTSTR